MVQYSIVMVMVPGSALVWAGKALSPKDTTRRGAPTMPARRGGARRRATGSREMGSREMG